VRRLAAVADHGGWIQTVTPGGDVVTAVDETELRNEDDLSQAISAHAPGDSVTLAVVSGTRRHEVRVRLAPRPAAGATP
jgi:PDZ domain-containing protein